MTNSPQVYIYRSLVREYSPDPFAEDLPEGAALRALRRMAVASDGIDPFEASIRPGQRVVVKPNLVRSWHPAGETLYALITHPAVIRAVVDEVCRCLQGDGEIIIADAPMADTDFDALLRVTGLDRFPEYYWEKHRLRVTIRDLRKFGYRWKQQPGGYGYEARFPLPGDPAGYREVDLGSQSAFRGMPAPHLLEGTDVARRHEAVASHTETVNRYLVAQTILDADVLVSLPKLKTHSKVGVTINCKGMVGINGDKNWLPHFRWGSPPEGGDQFPPASQRPIDQQRMRLGRFVADTLLARDAAWAGTVLNVVQGVTGLAARAIKLPSFDPINGDWPGNDTAWRLAADLARVAVFADRNGQLREVPQRSFLSVVDGIVGGEGEGPLKARPKACGVLIAGTHPVAVDAVGCRLMGFDLRRVHYLRELVAGVSEHLEPGFGPVPIEAIRATSNFEPWRDPFEAPIEALLGFAPPSRWEGQLELTADRPPAMPASGRTAVAPVSTRSRARS